MTAVIEINHLISTQVSVFKCNFEKNTPIFKTDIHFSCTLFCLTLLYLHTIKKKNPFMFTCSKSINHFLLQQKYLWISHSLS